MNKAFKLGWFAAAMMSLSSANAKTYTSVFTEDFEYSDDGWTWANSAHELTSRTLIDGETTSQFLHITSTKWNRGDYSFSSDCTALTDYKLEFDWFANMGYNAKTCRLYVYAGEGELFQIADPNAKSSNYTTAYLYLNGADSSDTSNASATFTTAARGNDCTGTSNQAYWYHITVTADESSGVYLTIASQDSSIGTVYNSRIADFTNVTAIAFTADSNSYETYGGIDDIIFSKGEAESFVWTGGSDNCWTNPANWTLDGTVQSEKYPTVGDSATVELADQTISVPMGCALGAITVDSTTVFSVDATDAAEKEEVDLFYMSEGSSTLSSANLSLTGKTDCAIAYDFTDPLAVKAAFWPKTYLVWTGNGGDTLWTTAANWAYGEGSAAEAYPGGDSTAVFPASLGEGASVTLDANASAALITVDSAVSLDSSGTTRRTIYPASVDGSGTLSLGNVSLQTPTYGKVTLSCNVAVASTDTRFYLRGKGATLTLTGALSGSGTLTLDGDGNGDKPYRFTGSMEDFTGTISMPSSAAVCYYFGGDDSTLNLTNATLEVNDTLVLNGTYQNGALLLGKLSGEGTITNATSSALTLQVGCDGDDLTSSAAFVSDYPWVVAKVGSNTVALTGESNWAAAGTLDGGIIKLPASAGASFTTSLKGVDVKTWSETLDEVAMTAFKLVNSGLAIIVR